MPSTSVAADDSSGWQSFSPDEQYFRKSKLNGVESFIVKGT